MPGANEICQKCQMPKESTGGGSITQWIFICRCNDFIVPDEPAPGTEIVELCGNCGKHISAGRHGSLTQFIFRSDLCSCQTPAPIRKQRPITQTAAPAFEAYVEDGSEPELPLEPDRFPLGRYKPLILLGKGAAGEVYLCRDRLLGKKVAVKTLTELNANQLMAFQLEAKATSKLTHPSIVTVMDFGATESGSPFMVMEYIDGISVYDLLQQTGPLSMAQAVSIAERVSDALSYVHGFHIFHRDLKPSNILLSRNDAGEYDVWLIDFGVAHIKFETTTPTVYQGHTLVGTPAYMSPDQMYGLQYDDRCEVYSLGCVLFEMLTGRPPFMEKTSMETLSMHAHEAPPPLAEMMDVAPPVELENIVAKCLAKNPDVRFQSMKDLHSQLVRVKAVVARTSAGAYEGADTNISTIKNSTTFWRAVAIVIGLVGLISVAVAAYFALNQKRPEVTTTKTNLPPSMIKDSNPTVVHQINDAKVQIFRGNYCKIEGEMTAHDFKVLSQLNKHIRVIDTVYAKHIDWQGLQYLGALTVTNIKFPKKSNITDDDLKYVGMMKGLTELRIPVSKVNGSGLKYLEGMPIEILVIDWTTLSDPDAFNSIGKLKRLRRLQMTDTAGWSGTAIAPIKDLPLRELHVSRTDLLDSGAKIVGTMKRLKILKASTCGITDEGLKSLSRLKLHTLDINQNNITVPGLLCLMGMTTLRDLTVTDFDTYRASVRELRKRNRLLKTTSSNTVKELFLYDKNDIEDGFADLAK